MNSQEKKLLDKIKEKAIYVDWNIAFGGLSRGNHHLERVQRIADYLRKHEGGDEFIVKAGAWVHDVSLASGSDDDPSKIANETSKFLEQFQLDAVLVKQIVEAVVSHEGDVEASSIEAKVIHDADVVDKSGMLGVVRHIWKMTNLLENRVLLPNDLRTLKTHLDKREQKVFTETAKQIVNKLNLERDAFFEDREFAEVMIGKISTLAKKGITSDLIAEKIKFENHICMKNLYSQLNLKYIEKNVES